MLLTVIFLMICCTKMALVNMWVLRGACCSSRRSSWPTTGSSSGPALLTRRLCSINLSTRGRSARMETQTPHSLSLQNRNESVNQAYRKSALSILPKTENVLLRNTVFSDKTPETKTNKNWVSSELKKQMQWRISCFPYSTGFRKPSNQHFPGLNKTFLKP